MQTLLATLLASETFQRHLAKPRYIAAVLALMALTVVGDFAGLYLQSSQGRSEVTRAL